MRETVQEPVVTRGRRPELRIEHLYFMLALTAVSFYVALVPIVPHDFWFHLRAGQLHSELGQVLRVDTFSWSVPANKPYLYGSWLGEWLYYQIYSAGGVPLVVFTRNVLATLAFALIGLEARRRSDSWRLAALAVALAGAIASSNAIVRPQNWSWVPFALYFMILSRYAARQLRPVWLLVLPALMIFWSNTHGVFVLGIVMIGLFAVGETLRRFLHDSGALTWPQIGAIYATGAITLLATAANPRGFGIFAYHLSALTDKAVHGLVDEWQPPTPSGLANVVFFGSVLMLLAAFAFARRKPTITDVLVVSAFLWLAWDAVRSMTWYGMVAMPVLVQCLGRPYARETTATRARQLLPLNLAIGGTLILAVLLAQPWTVRGLPLPNGYQEQIVPPPAPPLLSTLTPVSAAEHLRRNPGGKLFNDMGYGSYLIWAVPEQKVFIDPRIELYPLQQWLDYVDISSGYHSVELLERYGADRVLLNREEQARLSQALSENTGWKREYTDPWTEVWRYTRQD